MNKIIHTIDSDGIKTWRLDGELHRKNGPAVIYPDGSKDWYVNGKLHRVTGPAMTDPNGAGDWYLNGERYTFIDWRNKIENY